MMAWDNGGIEPVYLCDSHADQLGDSVKNYELSAVTTGRLIGNKQTGKQHPTTGNAQTGTRDLAPAKPQRIPLSGAPSESSSARLQVIPQPGVPPTVQTVAQVVAPAVPPINALPGAQHSTQIVQHVANPDVQSVVHVAQATPNPSVTVTAPVSGSTNGDSAKSLTSEANGNTVPGESGAYRPALNGTPDQAEEAKNSGSAEPARLCRSRNGERCTCDATVHCPTCGAWFCDAHAEDETWHPCLLTM